MQPECECDFCKIRKQGAAQLVNLLPSLRDLCEKQKALNDAFASVNKQLRPHGYSLYWDDTEEHYSIYALPQALDGTYQFGMDA